MKAPRQILLALGLAALPSVTWARCFPLPLQDVYVDSIVVFIGEVVELRLLTPTPSHEEKAKYEVTFRSTRSVKGRSPMLFRAEYELRYHEAYPPLLDDTDISVVQVTDDQRSYEMGQKYLILLDDQRQRITNAQWSCNARIRYITPDVMKQLEGLRQ